MKDFHYVYIITNITNSKYYIGKHSTNKIDDSYMGSGKNLKRALTKYGLSSFKKEIISFHDNEHDAYDEEERLLKIHVGDRMCYNISIGKRGAGTGLLNHQYGKPGYFTGRKHSKESRELMSKKAIGNKNAPTSPVSMFTKDDKFIRKFDSCADAAEYLGRNRINSSITIASCARGVKKSMYGYNWKYVN